MSQLNTDRFSNFSCRFLNPNNFFQFQLWLFWYIISKLVRYHQQQDKKVFCYQKLVWPFTAWINCSSDFKKFANSLPSALNFKKFSRSLEQFFFTVGQNNFGNKIPLFNVLYDFYSIFYLFYKDLVRIVYNIFDEVTTNASCQIVCNISYFHILHSHLI